MSHALDFTRQSILVALCMLATNVMAEGAIAVHDPVGSSARVALAKGEYAKVLGLYDPLIESGSLPALAHYRYAIAAERLNKYQIANRSLQRAMTLDTTGGFASSKERIDSLSQSIASGCSRQPDCSLDDTDQGSPNPDSEENSSAQNSPAVSQAIDGPSSSTTVTDPSTPAAIHEQVSVAAELDQSNTRDNTRSDVPTLRGPSRLAVPVAVAALVMLLMTLRKRRLRTLISKSGDQHAYSSKLIALREIMAEVLELGKRTSPMSEMVVILTNSLAVVERECGRSLYSVSGSTEHLTDQDRAILHADTTFRNLPINVLHSSTEEVSRAFQRQSWH